LSVAEEMIVSALADVRHKGFALLRDTGTEASSIQFAARLGTIDKVEGLAVMQSLTPGPADDSPPNTYSGNFGLMEFPLHTDLAHWARPPHYLLLRCIHGNQCVATRILDGYHLIQAIGRDQLCATLVQPRRPMRNGKQLLRILSNPIESSCDLLRWDSIYLHPATRRSSKVFGVLREFLSHVRPQEVNLQRGDTLLLDNWRCLHGRSAVTETERTRLIERVYLMEVR